MISGPIFVAGGLGFIGSNLVRRLLADGERVVVYDDFSSGRTWHLDKRQEDEGLTVVRGDLKDFDLLQKVMNETRPQTVYHFASNPDIAKAMTDPLIDFWEGSFLTQNVLEASRRVGTVRRVMYASGSGVYGDAGTTPVHEEMGPVQPRSTYGASKVAGEALLSAYWHMYGLQAFCFRFANVVGPCQTHGVSYDFVRKLSRDPKQLKILGDGSQSKSYIHVDDVMEAMQVVDRSTICSERGFDYWNVATEDYVTVTEIADMAVKEMGLTDVVYQYTGGDKGWKGDVPIVRFNSEKMRSLGWKNRYTTREALRISLRSTLDSVNSGRTSVL
jgi:UDP-glucose 4-epimerase